MSKATAQPKPTAGKAAETRAEILVAAAHLFAEKGYSECNLRELAEKVGMKAGSFYYHFKSKEEILDDLIEASLELLTERVLGALADLPPDATARSRIEVAMRVHVAVFLSTDHHASVFLRVWEYLPPMMRRRKLDKRRAYGQIWYGLFEDGLREGAVRTDIPLRLLVPHAITGMNRTIEWFNPRFMTVEDVCNTIVRINLEGGLLLPLARQPA